MPRLLLPLLVLSVACGTSSGDSRFDPALEGLSLVSIQPALALPGSRLQLHGRSFVGQPWGTPSLHVEGLFDNGSEQYQVEFTLPARFVDLETLEVDVDDALLDAFGSSSGDFSGSLRVDVESSIDKATHSSPPLTAELQFRESLTPVLSSFTDTGPLFVNDKILVEGEGLLLGGDEGSTFAVIEGCFVTEGVGACQAIEGIEIELQPESAFDRKRAAFAFLPEIAGIQPGEFQGTLTLRNRHGVATSVIDSQQKSATYDLSATALFSLGPAEASLGQYLEIAGAGFVDLDSSSSTLLELRGEFVPPMGRPVSLDIILVPEFVEGRRLRYTINEDDTLGQLVDLRYARGTFSGEITASTSFAGQTVAGEAMSFAFDIAPVKQVVYLNFTSQYLDALRAFGLRAMDASIRQRVAQVVRRDFRSVNLEVRLEEPTDFSLYSTVEIGGSDPNGLGLLGYDNTPGKDSGNLRLHDHIGGINATTQQDGFPGYGGVFIESVFVFSEHPGEFAPRTQVGSPVFDDLFDPFRPDRNGSPVRASDLAAGVSMPSSGEGCPANQREEQIACASFALANIVGTTISHEIGHSLGLANPAGGDSHHLSDAPNRLMDSGSSREFEERAELLGKGPGHFCDEAYQYLRLILPSDEPEDMAGRPTCF